MDSETVVDEEFDVPNEDIIGAIDAELEAVDVYDEPEPEGEPEPEPEAEPEAEPDVAETPEPDKDKDPEAKQEKAEEPKPAAEPRPSDEFEALEEGTPERTKQRFEAVKAKYDQLTVERDAIRSEADQWVSAITETGTNPEQFANSLSYLTLVNSKDPADLEKAYNFMQGELQELGKTLGKAAPGHNPLDEHPDLKTKVEDGMLDEDAALEVARARATTKLIESTRAAERNVLNEKNEVSNALEDVRQLGFSLKSSDPNFEAKAKMLAPIIESVVSSGTPPSRWKSMIEATYAKIPEPFAVGPTTPRSTAPNPIRPTGTSPASGQMDKEPGSALEAINAALERGW
jgi:hypothetical protein